jgi:hypothetical protein
MTIYQGVFIMSLRITVPSLALLLLCAAPLLAAEPVVAPVSSLEERLQELEARQAELYHTLAGKKEAGLATHLTERLTFSGLIEIEAGAEKLHLADGSRAAASDLAVATVQLGLGAKVNETVSGNISVLFEEDASALDVDEATIDLAQGPWSARIGRQYLPFGVYNSHFISDPLTLALGETRETALLAGYSREYFSLSAFVFNGDVDKIGADDRLGDWGASLVLTPRDGIEVGGSFLSDLADSDAELLSTYESRVGGWSAFAALKQGPFWASAEILGALKDFAAADLDANGDANGDRPLAWNLEVAWAPLEQIELAARYEGSREFAGQPERQYGVSASWSPAENVTLALEYLRGTFDQGFGVDADGNILDKRDLVSAQLAVAF